MKKFNLLKRVQIIAVLIILISVFSVCSKTEARFLQDKTQQKISTEIEEKNYVEGEVLVKYKKDKINLETSSGREAAEKFSCDKSMEKKENLEKINVSVLKINDNKTVKEKIAELKNYSNVEYVEPNYKRYPFSISTNDTHKNLLWGLDNTGQVVGEVAVAGTEDADIDAPEAWAISEGDNDIVVAVIDDGVDYNHPDLGNNMWDGSNCVDENGSVLGGCNHGYDYEDNDKDPSPESINDSHGTHIAGTIGAVKNNNEGIIGVAPNVKIMAIKFGLDIAAEVKAINFAINNGAKIINASYGGSTFSQAEYDAVSVFKDAGGIFVAAAGNGGPDQIGDDNDTIPQYPSDYDLDNIISVAATDQNDSLASWSNYGTISVDVGAPGVSIYSTIPYSTIGKRYDYKEGTSMAVPHVVGLAGLIWGYKPDLTYSQVRDIILNTGDDKLSGEIVTGKRINAYNALSSIEPILSEVIPVPILTNDDTPEYTFNSDEAGTISYDGGCTSVTTDAVEGDNTIIFNKLADGIYGSCTIIVTDSFDNQSAPLNVSQFTVDTIAPTIHLDAVDGDTASLYYTNDNTPEIILSGEANMVCRWSTADTVYSVMNTSNECTISVSQASCTLSDQGEDGEKTVYISCKDEVDNEQSTAQNLDVTFTLDTTKPEVSSATASSDPAKAGEITIFLDLTEQGVGLDTNISPIVTITGLDTTYTVEQDSFVESESQTSHLIGRIVFPSATWTGTFTLLDEDEEKTATISVAGARDLAGNVMDTNSTAGTFEVDTKEPVSSTITSPSSATTINADIYAIEGIAEADSLIKVYKGETLVGSQQLDGGATNFSIEVNLEQNADNIFKVTATDSVGNEGQAVTIFTITEDSISLTTALISLDGDTASPYYTNDNTPEIILSGEASMVCRWSINNTVYSAMDSDNECTISVSQASCTLSDQGEDSQKTVYISCKDEVDNEQSTAQNLDVTFTLDTTKPEVSSATASSDPAKAGEITIFLDLTEQGVGLDTNISPIVTITGLDTTYTVEKTSFTDTAWTGTFTLLDENEEKTATITVAGARDLAGNVMDDNNSAGTFEVDTKEPTAISVSINNDAVYINTTSITLTISAFEASQMKITGDITDSIDWIAYATSTSTTLTSGDEEKNITVFFKDEISNETQVSDSIILDQTKPEVSSATASSDPAKAGTVTITLNFLEENGLNTEISPTVTILSLNTTSTVEQISYSGTTWKGSFTLLDENEEKTAVISVVGAKDLVGNVMDANNNAGTFEVDTITPSIDSVSPAADATEKEVTTDITVNFNEEIDIDTLEFSLDSVSGTTNYADKTFIFTPEERLSYNKEYTAKILVKDIAGNLMDEFIWSFKTKTSSYSGGGGGGGGVSITAPLLPEGEEEEEEEILEVTPTKEIIPISQGGGASVVLPEKTEVSVEIPSEAVPVPESPEILAEIETTISPMAKTVPVVSEPVSSIPEKKEIVGNYVYEFSSTVGGTAVEVFEKPVTLKFTYTDEQIEGLDEETLTVNYWDEDFLEWIVLPTVVDKENNVVTATTTHFTYYIVMADIIIEEPIIPEIPVVEKEEPLKEAPIKKLTIKEIKLKIIELLTKLIELFTQLSKFVKIKE